MATRPQQPEGNSDLPSNVIPFRQRGARRIRIEIDSPIPSTDMEPAEYEAAWLSLCCYADEARAYQEYIERRFVLLWRVDRDSADDLAQERRDAFERMRAFAHLLASLPIPMNSMRGLTRRHLERKKRIIGRVWLGAEGEQYDAFRASVAADEAMLKLGRA